LKNNLSDGKKTITKFLKITHNPLVFDTITHYTIVFFDSSAISQLFEVYQILNKKTKNILKSVGRTILGKTTLRTQFNILLMTICYMK